MFCDKDPSYEPIIHIGTYLLICDALEERKRIMLQNHVQISRIKKVESVEKGVLQMTLNNASKKFTVCIALRYNHTHDTPNLFHRVTF